jgi:hypothetical protein
MRTAERRQEVIKGSADLVSIPLINATAGSVKSITYETLPAVIPATNTIILRANRQWQIQAVQER